MKGIFVVIKDKVEGVSHSKTVLDKVDKRWKDVLDKIVLQHYILHKDDKKVNTEGWVIVRFY